MKRARTKKNPAAKPEYVPPKVGKGTAKGSTGKQVKSGPARPGAQRKMLKKIPRAKLEKFEAMHKRANAEAIARNMQQGMARPADSHHEGIPHPEPGVKPPEGGLPSPVKEMGRMPGTTPKPTKKRRQTRPGQLRPLNVFETKRSA